MNEEQIIDKVSMIDQWKVSGDSYTQGELDAIGQLLELYYDNKKQLEQEKEKNKELENQINFNKKTVEIAQTQILEYSQGYKDGLNKETTATAIVARELELNFIRQEIKHKYISKDKIKDMMKYREFELQQEYKEFEEDVEWRTYKKILEV